MEEEEALVMMAVKQVNGGGNGDGIVGAVSPATDGQGLVEGGGGQENGHIHPSEGNGCGGGEEMMMQQQQNGDGNIGADGDDQHQQQQAAQEEEEEGKTEAIENHHHHADPSADPASAQLTQPAPAPTRKQKKKRKAEALIAAIPDDPEEDHRPATQEVHIAADGTPLIWDVQTVVELRSKYRMLTRAVGMGSIRITSNQKVRWVGRL